MSSVHISKCREIKGLWAWLETLTEQISPNLGGLGRGGSAEVDLEPARLLSFSDQGSFFAGSSKRQGVVGIP
jgi:hypothetical protein